MLHKLRTYFVYVDLILCLIFEILSRKVTSIPLCAVRSGAGRIWKEGANATLFWLSCLKWITAFYEITIFSVHVLGMENMAAGAISKNNIQC